MIVSVTDNPACAVNGGVSGGVLPVLRHLQLGVHAVLGSAANQYLGSADHTGCTSTLAGCASHYCCRTTAKV